MSRTKEILLAPITLAYKQITFLRDKLFKKGILNPKKVEAFVISVGNISTGGTGKTPLVIYLAKYFLDRGYKTTVISRGYRRKSSELVVVFDGSNLLSKPAIAGDEPVLIANELASYKNACVIAFSDRVEAANYAINKFGAEIIILDDAFQHRYIVRDLDIVVLDASALHIKGSKETSLMPAGNLREQHEALKRADILVQNNKTGTYNTIPVLKELNKHIVYCSYKAGKIKGDRGNLLKGFNKQAIAFCGIAQPDSFFKMLSGEGIVIKEKIIYEDHHTYNVEDIQRIMKNYDIEKVFITTGKDYVKVSKFKNFINVYPVYYLDLELKFDKNYNILINEIDKRLNESRNFRNRQ